MQQQEQAPPSYQQHVQQQQHQPYVYPSNGSAAHVQQTTTTTSSDPTSSMLNNAVPNNMKHGRSKDEFSVVQTTVVATHVSVEPVRRNSDPGVTDTPDVKKPYYPHPPGYVPPPAFAPPEPQYSPQPPSAPPNPQPQPMPPGATPTPFASQPGLGGSFQYTQRQHPQHPPNGFPAGLRGNMPAPFSGGGHSPPRVSTFQVPPPTNQGVRVTAAVAPPPPQATGGLPRGPPGGAYFAQSQDTVNRSQQYQQQPAASFSGPPPVANAPVAAENQRRMSAPASSPWWKFQRRRKDPYPKETRPVPAGQQDLNGLMYPTENRSLGPAAATAVQDAGVKVFGGEGKNGGAVFW